jgi:hypothetical protein
MSIIIKFIFLLLFPFFGIQVVEAKIASTLIIDVRLMARDPSASGRTRFSDAQILDLINEGQRDAITNTLCIRKEYTFDTSSGTRYYSMPTDYITIDRVLHDDQKIEEKSPAKLDLASSEWETVTGEPINYFVNFSSRTKIGFYPYPVSGTSTATVKVEYYAQATELTSTDTPFNSITEFIPFHSMLTYYSVAQMMYIDGLVSSADRYLQRYMIYRQSFNDYCRARPGYSPNVNVTPVK